MSKLGHKKDHELVRDLLPWYVNETLQHKDEELVLRHLADCESCQVERDQLYELMQLVQEGEDVPGDVDASFANTWQRVEIAEQNRASVREIEQASVSTRRWIPFSFAAGLLLLVGWVGVQESTVNVGGEYQTLTSGAVPASGDDPRRMELAFENPIPAQTLRQTLIDTRSNIVSGPDDAGVYIIEVQLSADADERLYLSTLRQLEGVRHARFLAP